MTTQEQINALESRQLSLLGVMGRSDAHAAKCVKLGVSFAENYPDDLAAYNAANEEYNRNEETLAALYGKRAGEIEAEAAAPRDAAGEGEA